MVGILNLWNADRLGHFELPIPPWVYSRRRIPKRYGLWTPTYCVKSWITAQKCYEQARINRHHMWISVAGNFAMLAHCRRHVYRVPEVARAPAVFRHHFHNSRGLRVGNIQRLFWVPTFFRFVQTSTVLIIYLTTVSDVLIDKITSERI